MQLWVSVEIVCDFVTRDPVVDWRCSIPWQNHSERLVLGVRIQVGRKWQRKFCGQREFHPASVVASMPAAADVRAQSADAQERPGMRAGTRSVNVAPAKRHEGKRRPEEATNNAQRKQPTKRSAKLC